MRARTGAALVGSNGDRKPMPPGHAAAILRDLDLAVDDEQVVRLVDLMFL
jgi:hypothetical protein